MLAVGPGWDWNTLIGLYPNVSVYTEQLRALESYCNLNPKSAPARFVLAYFYLTQGNTRRGGESVEAGGHAGAQRHRVLAVDPEARETSATRRGGGGSRWPPGPGTQLTPTTLTGPAGTGKEGRLQGTWTAQTDPDTTITLTFLAEGKFTWKIAHKGQDRTIQGKLTLRQWALDPGSGSGVRPWW